jgi:hypothetical protein
MLTMAVMPHDRACVACVACVAGVTTVVMLGCGLLVCTAAYAGTPKPMITAPVAVKW